MKLATRQAAWVEEAMQEVLAAQPRPWGRKGPPQAVGLSVLQLQGLLERAFAAGAGEVEDFKDE